MVLPIGSKTERPVYSSLDLFYCNRRGIGGFLDELQYGKGGGSSFFFTKVSSFFYKIYETICFLFGKIFFCFKEKESLYQKYQRNLRELDHCLLVFSDKKKRKDERGLKAWWQKTFLSLDYEIRKLLILQDVMTYAEEGMDKEDWAQKNYTNRRVLSTQFVSKLEKVSDSVGGTYDPMDYVPMFIENVKAILQEKITELS